MEGLVSGDFHLYGPYETPFGFGKLVIEHGIAYGETFERATSSLRFEGNGVRLDSLDIHKSGGGVTGAAFVGWDGNYSFNADGARIPVESLKTATVPAGAARRACSSSRDRRAARSTSRATTSSSASTTCSPATKASAS